MSDISVTEVTGWTISVPHHPAACRVSRARERLREELCRYAVIQQQLSCTPGAPPEFRSDYWLGIISGTASFLLWALDSEEAARA